MTRIVVNGEGDRLSRALKLLGPKVLAYDARQGWLMVRKEEAESVVRALAAAGIEAEITTIGCSSRVRPRL